MLEEDHVHRQIDHDVKDDAGSEQERARPADEQGERERELERDRRDREHHAEPVVLRQPEAERSVPLEISGKQVLL